MANTNNRKRRVEKELRRIHPLMIALPVAFLLLGVLLGYVLCPRLLRVEDGFSLKGEKTHTYAVTEVTTASYAEEGYCFSLFGVDLSDYVEVSSTLPQEGGVYRIDLSGEGVYSITYTVVHPLFYRDVRLVRTFTVEGGE